MSHHTVVVWAVARYLRLGKAEVVDRLLAAESAYAEQEQRWLSQQDEAFTWRLRAEAAEAHLKASLPDPKQIETGNSPSQQA